MADRPEISIIVPVYNEAENFPRVYQAIRSRIHTPNRILVVYDFDADTTVPVVRRLARSDPKLKLVKNTLGRGALNAVKSGFAAVTSGPCLVTMADLSDDLTGVDRMYQHYLDGSQVVCGSRYMKGGRQLGGPPLKRLLSRLAGLSLHYVRRLPTHDVTNNFKLYDAALLQEITIESRAGFEIAMEITVKAFKRGAKITEIPTTWTDRAAGQSNFKLWRWLPSYLRWYFYALF